jgi:L-aspartate oxidase
LPVEVVGTGVAGCDPSMRASLQRAMTEGAGVVRDEGSLAVVAGVLDEVAATPGDGSVAALEVANLAAVGSALVAAARRRTESRGAHTRIDAPDLDGEQARRVVCRRVDGGAEPFDVATAGGAG